MLVRIIAASWRASWRAANLTVLYTILNFTTFTHFLKNLQITFRRSRIAYPLAKQEPKKRSTKPNSRKYIDFGCRPSDAASTVSPRSSNPELRPHIPHVKYTPGGSPTSPKLLTFWLLGHGCALILKILKMILTLTP